jgi:DNA polymerase III alpha subunit
MKTQLKNRTLWFDGTSEVNPDDVPSLILSGVSIEKIAVTEINEDIKLFNSLADEDICSNKSLNKEYNKDWKIPEFYKTFHFDNYVYAMLHEFFKRKNITDPVIQDKYSVRSLEELAQIKDRDIEMIFRTIVYIIDKLRKSDTLWGVGRGSSCASLVLFLLGLHAVDPIKYNIPMEEFFHD